MCGITGFWNSSNLFDTDTLCHIVQQMSNTLYHRGPDDGGQWVDAQVGIALGHRRLAIVDLSPLGHQPMVSDDDRYVLVFNGEIYNFLDLQAELKALGYRFRSHSDTEVMLASFTQWGIDQAIQRFNGMFAFALWDRGSRSLFLGRDRIGEKPLYYGWMGQTFLFGSELKALKLHPDFQPEINRDALTLFLRHGYIPTPYSIYQGIYKLPAGTVLNWKGTGIHPDPVSYWSAKTVAELGATTPFTGSESHIIAQFDALLQDAVNLRMIADVPLGAFLSGGIDSSTIVALMQAQSGQSVKTFTIGFEQNSHNEAQYAKAVAQHLGTDHTELYVTPQETIAVIPKLPSLYDEPFADNSQIPTFLISQLAKQQVTVSLSGDGGDELLAGYDRYFWGRNTWQSLSRMPVLLRQTSARALTQLSPQGWNQRLAAVTDVLPKKLKQPTPGDKLHWIAEILATPDSEALYAGMMSQWKEPETLVVRGIEPLTLFRDRNHWAQRSDFTQHMMYLDTVTYLPDDILVKVDRASMGVSLESRIPLLDHRVVEFAWRVPLSMKIRNNQGKWLLRQVLNNYVPSALIERPKQGFGMPIASWLRGALRDWADALLNEHRLQQEGFLYPKLIRQKWKEHLAGDRDWQYHLWTVLMFQAWLENH